MQEAVDRHSSLMAVGDRGDDVLRPNAASPPKNTFGTVDWKVLASSFGRPHASNSMPQSASIHGNAFSWPTATSTSSQSNTTSGAPVGFSVRLPFAS